MKNGKKFNQEMLNLESIIGVASFAMFFAAVINAAYISMTTNSAIWILMIIVAVVFFVTIALVMLRIEQIVGYYQCKNCRHKYVPKYRAVLWGMHVGRKRYMRCPKCKKMTWQRKVV